MSENLVGDFFLTHTVYHRFIPNAFRTQRNVLAYTNMHRKFFLVAVVQSRSDAAECYGGSYLEKKHSESENFRQAAILNSVKSLISCRNYFCRIAKFGEDILNHGRPSLRFSARRF